jgi:XRE family transcriptional regulator of biofilm formation
MNYQGLGFAVLRRRREKGLSQQDLAGLANVSRNYISMIERGEVKNISVEVLVKLAKALNVDPVYWLQILLEKEGYDD